MKYILLSGGSGKRLWPLSNGVRSKQFLKIFLNSDGNHESMIQRMYRMLCEVDSTSSITIATSKSQVASIHHQLKNAVDICIEPCRRDTFPAIILSAAYLVKNGASKDDVVVVCPIDPYVNKDYFECLNRIGKEAKEGDTNITLMGITPTFASPKYGYIIPENEADISYVKEFKEKPISSIAQEYIKQGGLWNGGVFAFKLGYILGIARDKLGTDDYDEIYKNYESYASISFDYAVVERESKIKVVRFDGQWKDLGTWNTLPDAMSENVSGNSKAIECNNTHVVNELSIPLITMGINNAVVVATHDGILVADKETSSKIKEFASDIMLRPMHEKREWGEYKVLDYQNNDSSGNYLTKELIIQPGNALSYQLHKKKTETWTIVKGKGILLIDGETRDIGQGDVVHIKPKMCHSIKAITEMRVIEVQIGDNLMENDTLKIENTIW